MKIICLISFALFASSCARITFNQAPEPFKPIPIDRPLEARQANFENHKVTVLGPNHGQVAGKSYNAIELIRYYDDSHHADASELQKKAQAKILRADDWAVYGIAYGSILGVVIGGLSAYFATSNFDFRALDAAGQGALGGLGWGTLGGLAVGLVGFSAERQAAQKYQKEASEEFNRTAKTMLRIVF